MGRGSNWHIVHPDMGTRRLTLNHGLHEPGLEFTQNLHDESEDTASTMTTVAPPPYRRQVGR